MASSFLVGNSLYVCPCHVGNQTISKSQEPPFGVSLVWLFEKNLEKIPFTPLLKTISMVTLPVLQS